MPINYVLFENNLTSDPNDYMAMVQPSGTADLEAVIERMIQQGSTVVKADVLSVLEDYHSAIENMVLEGMSITTPGANFGASVKGVFDGQADSFESGRHQLTGTVSPGKRFRKAIRGRGQVTKQEAVKPMPNLLEYTDFISGERNSVLTPGGMGQVVGHRLKFDPAAADQGLFFVAEDGGETRVDVVGRNKPGDLMFTVPAGLVAGDYTLEVRATLRGSEELRTGVLWETLSVS